MSLFPHHTSDEVCPMCSFKLKSAHPYLRDWFNTWVKPKYINAHISWAFRGEEDQEQAFADHKTLLHWPKSPHNHEEGGLPMSMALDLFQIDEDGVARFSPLFYAKLAQEIEADKLPLFWGGKWKHLGDLDHIEYQPPKQ
jgi:hypothetical protein